MYLGIFLIVLAVVGSATGSILNEHLGIPEYVGPVIIFAVITTLAFYGRSLVEKVMVFLTVFLYAAFIFYFISALSANSDQIALQFSSTTDYWPKGWLVPGLQFAVYSSPAAILIIFATHGITTRTEAFVSGTLCGLLVMIPGFLFHISFLGVLPDVLEQPVPVHWIINKLDVPLLLPIYLVALIGTFIGSGTGFIQAVNERLDHWSMERTGSVYPPWIHSSVAIAGLMISAALAQFGIITLIAKGYGNAAWGFLVLFVIPVLTVGAYKIFFRRMSLERQAEKKS
jgi:uncharacterized membrane protein YkvI